MKPGIYYDISDEIYQTDCCDAPSLSSSIAKILVNDTPLHAWMAHPKLNPAFEREEKEIFDLGTVAHALLLQGEHIAEIIGAPDWRTKDAQMLRDDARSRGKIPILMKHMVRVR